MSQQVKIGTVAHCSFPLYEADGRTKRADAAADVSTLLLRDGVLAAEAVTVAEDTPLEYTARFTPLQAGSYTVVIRDTVRGTDYVETFQAGENLVDDVADMVAQLAARDALVSVIGVGALRVGEAWSPTLVFLRRSTMTPIDPDAIATLEILSGDAQTVLETIEGEDLVRSALGRYLAAPAVLATAGVAFLRVTFTVDGVAQTDVIWVSVAPALGEVAVASGGGSVMARVYTCPAFIRQARFPLGDRTDADVWRLIRGASAHVEAVSQGNRFNGEYGAYACSGRGTRVVYHPEQIPFCWLETVEVDGDLTDHTRNRMFIRTLGSYGVDPVDATDYTLRAGMVEHVRRGFPVGAGNVTVTGAAGCVSPARYVASTSTTEVGAESNYVDVANVARFSSRDVLEIVGESGAIRTIVTAVDASLSRLFFDPQGGEFSPIEIGAIVRTFGQVPLAIEQITNYLVGIALREEAANANGEEFYHPTKVQGEKTDDYEIRFQWLTAGNQTLLGNPKYDQMLAPYMKAIGVRFP